MRGFFLPAELQIRSMANSGASSWASIKARWEARHLPELPPITELVEPVMTKASACLASCLPPAKQPSGYRSRAAAAPVAITNPEQASMEAWAAAWTGHWVMTHCEDAKVDAMMRAQGLPYMLRRMLQRFRSERIFAWDANERALHMSSRTLSGGWADLKGIEGHRQTSSFFGFTFDCEVHWEGTGAARTQVVTTNVTDLAGGTSVSTAKHWLDGATLVNQVLTPNGEYKVFMRRQSLSTVKP